MPAPYLDRLLTQSSPGVLVTFNGTDTVIDLPFEFAEDGSEGTLVVLRDSPREVIPITATDPSQIVLGGVNVAGENLWIGVDYASYWQFSVIFSRDSQTDIPDQRGRLNLRYLKLHYQDATAFRVTVTAAGRPTRTYDFRASASESGTFVVPVQTQNTQALITVQSIVDDDPGVMGNSCSPFPAFFTGYEWEGVFYNRVRGGR